MPTPPYVHTTPSDAEDYQTVYSRHEGSIAAPTAGLHFTNALLATLRDRGVGVVFLTLHVGIGTFQPVKVAEVERHQMHAESYQVDAATAERINRARTAGHRVVAVGTTVARTLETVTDSAGHVHAGSGETELYIVPGFTFRCVDALITNFHLPRSTLLLLVSALAGRERILAAYRDAIASGYRFYSFGDAMLIT
jgi:S-adenosylmethionine:tRNA ribosyltransferase-isomerase